MKRLLVWLSTVMLMGASTIIFMGMGDRGKSNISKPGPSFVKLEEGRGVILATVLDGKTAHNVKNFSFSGETSVGGIRKENDASVRSIELAKIKEFVVTKAHYDGQYYRGQDFLVASILSATDYLMEDMLVPRDIVICGIDKDTLVEKAWNLGEVAKIIIHHPGIAVEHHEATMQENKVNAVESLNESVEVEIPVTYEENVKPKQVAKSEAYKKRNRITQGWDDEKSSKKKNELLDDMEKIPKGKKSLVDSFMAIFDAIIDFMKAIITTLIGFVR